MRSRPNEPISIPYQDKTSRPKTPNMSMYAQDFATTPPRIDSPLTLPLPLLDIASLTLDESWRITTKPDEPIAKSMIDDAWIAQTLTPAGAESEDRVETQQQRKNDEGNASQKIIKPRNQMIEIPREKARWVGGSIRRMLGENPKKWMENRKPRQKKREQQQEGQEVGQEASLDSDGDPIGALHPEGVSREGAGDADFAPRRKE